MHIFKSEVLGFLSHVTHNHRSSIRSRLLRTFESNDASARPSQYRTIHVRKRNDRVIEASLNVGLTLRNLGTHFLPTLLRLGFRRLWFRCSGLGGSHLFCIFAHKILRLFKFTFTRTHGLTNVATNRARICFRALPTNRQTFDMTASTVRTNFF